MRAFLYIVPLYAVMLVYTRNIKHFLIITAIISLPFRTTYDFFNFGFHTGWTNAIRINISDISMIVLLFYNYFNIKNSSIFNARYITLFVAYIFTSALSLLNSNMGMATLLQVVMIIQLVVLYYCVLYQAIETEEDINIIINGLLVSLYIQSILSIFQYVTGNAYDLFSTGRGISFYDNIDYMDNTGPIRVIGTIGKPNGLALYIVPIILINLAYIFLNKKYNVINVLGVVLGCITLVITFSRGGWLSFIAGSFYLYFILFKHNIIKFKNMFIIIISLLAIVIIFSDKIESRIYGDDHKAASSRIPLIKIAMNMIIEHPIVGIGSNTFRNEIRKYNKYSGIYLQQVHNQFLLIFAETGIMGLIAYLLLYIYAFKECNKCINLNIYNSIKGLGIGVYAGLIASIVHMNIDMGNSYAHLGSFFVYFAIVSAVTKDNYQYA